MTELLEARRTLGISQRAVARELGISQAQFWRIETGRDENLSVKHCCEIASVLGYEVALTLHPIGDAIRDRAQQAIGKRFDAILANVWTVFDEALLPKPGDKRSWDKLLRLRDAEARHVVGVDLESRIYDIQALVRRTRERERDGGVDEILIVLSDSAHNRRFVASLVEALGLRFQTSGADIRRALRRGGPLPGSGVILI